VFSTPELAEDAIERLPPALYDEVVIADVELDGLPGADGVVVIREVLRAGASPV
jgi:hypothetical protein